MTGLSQEVVTKSKKHLHGNVNTLYDSYSEDTLSRDEFLCKTWNAINSLVHHNRNNVLMRDAVRRYPNLILRVYVVICIRFGSFSYSPTITAVLRDVIEMLDKDIDEEELSACEYARSRNGISFYPELYQMREKVFQLYASRDFESSVLSPTPHYAFVLLANNDKNAFFENVSPQMLYGRLQVLARQMDRLYETIAHKR